MGTTSGWGNRTYRWVTQFGGFAFARIGLLRKLPAPFHWDVPRTELIFPFFNCQACELAWMGCPIGMLQLYVIERRFPFYLIGYLVIISALLGRAICGWLCPFGFFLDIIDKFTKGDWRPKWIGWHYMKYVMLVGAVVGAVLLSDIIFCQYFCFTGIIFGTTMYWLTWHTVTMYWFVYKMGLLTAFIYMTYRAGGMAWCRYLCPFGAFLSIFNPIALIQLKFDESACTNCGQCNRACPMDINPVGFTLHDKLGCTRCGDCLSVCPKDALTIGGINLLPARAQMRHPEAFKRNAPCTKNR